MGGLYLQVSSIASKVLFITTGMTHLVLFGYMAWSFVNDKKPYAPQWLSGEFSFFILFADIILCVLAGFIFPVTCIAIFIPIALLTIRARVRKRKRGLKFEDIKEILKTSHNNRREVRYGKKNQV